MSKEVKIFIVEGADRDYRFVQEMTHCFFVGKYETQILELPAEMNIFMLYDLLKQDDFDSDLIELLRDNSDTIRKQLKGIDRQQISEIYMFFDYDIQHLKNADGVVDADEAVLELLETFDNETDNGKLYISYPMVEAVYDIMASSCQSLSNCLVPIQEISKYKNMTGEHNSFANHALKINEWRSILATFGLRLSCLFGWRIDYNAYREITPKEIYICEKDTIKKHNERIFVLSAFPEFLFDYFPSGFWGRYNTRRKFKYKYCPKGK